MTTVAIYREDLLAPSEGFVVEPARHLRRYRPVLVGTRRVAGSRPHGLPDVVLTDGPGLPARLRVAAYRTRGGLGLHRRVAAHRPALVHAHFALDAVQAMPLAGRLGVPLVVTTHGYDVLSPEEVLRASHRGRAYLAGRARLAREAALLLPVSDFLLERMRLQGFPDHVLRRHYLGVDTAFFDPCSPDVSAPGGAAAGDRILVIARLVEYKSVDHVLHAAAEVARSRPGTRVTVVGEGPLRGELERLAARLRVDARFVGVRTRAQVRDHLADADVLVSASHPRREGVTEAFGLNVVEAQAMRVPVVGYASGGVVEGVADGETGVLAEAGDVRGLAAALQRVLGDREAAAVMGRRGRARALERFDMATQAHRLEDLYDEVVAR